MMAKMKVLICPLDWGMGHATRMMPVIDYLQNNNYEVSIAAGANTILVIKNEYPSLSYFLLPKISPRYTRYRKMLVPTLLLQLPGLFAKVVKEHFVVWRIVRKYKIDAVISDNRLGLWGLPVKSAYVTHQLNFKLTGFFRALSPFMTLLHRFVMNQYDQVFIPDVAGAENLAGQLSDVSLLKNNFAHIGILSRLSNGGVQSVGDSHVLILLSGQEPQRTMLEQILIRQAGGISRNFVLVKGKLGIPGEAAINVPRNVKVVSFAKPEKVAELIRNSSFVICRSGYSSVMDLVVMQKRAILVPTPGQSEQEYLAQYWMDKNWFFSQPQSEVDLVAAMQKVDAYNPPFWPGQGQEMTPIVDWLKDIEKENRKRK